MNSGFLLRLAFLSFNLARIDTDISVDQGSAIDYATDELLAP